MRRCSHLLVAFLALFLLTASVGGFTSQFVSLEGVNHHIRDTGSCDDSSAPLVVFFHGFTGSTAAFVDSAPILFANGIRACAIDRVGFGRTARPQPSPLLAPPPSLPFALDIARLLEERGELAPGAAPSGLAALIPSIPSVLSTGLRRPETLAIRGAWDGPNPYSTEFAVSTIPLLLRELNISAGCEVYFVGHSAGSPVALQSYINAASSRDYLPDGVKLGGCFVVAPAGERALCTQRRCCQLRHDF